MLEKPEPVSVTLPEALERRKSRLSLSKRQQEFVIIILSPDIIQVLTFHIFTSSLHFLSVSSQNTLLAHLLLSYSHSHSATLYFCQRQ